MSARHLLVPAAAGLVALLGCGAGERADEAAPAPAPAAEPAAPAAVAPAPSLDQSRRGLDRLGGQLGLDTGAIDVGALGARYPDGWAAFSWRDQIVDYFQPGSARFHFHTDRASAAIDAEGELIVRFSVYDGLQRMQVDQLDLRVDLEVGARGALPVAFQDTRRLEVEVLVTERAGSIFVLGIGPASG